MSISSLWSSGGNAVAQILGELSVDGRVIVVDAPKVARRLDELGRDVLSVLEVEKPPRRGPASTQAIATSLPLPTGAAAAVVVAGAAHRDDWNDVLVECARVSGHDGPVVLLDRADPVELCRRALCAGLVDIHQREIARQVLTWGRARRFGD